MNHSKYSASCATLAFLAFGISQLFLGQGLRGHQLQGFQDEFSITRVAPEKCTIFFGWTGELNDDAQGAETERWLAQPAIQNSVAQLRSAISQYLEMNSTEQPGADELIKELPWLMIRQPFAIYVSNFDISVSPPVAIIGAVLELGDKREWMQAWLEKTVSEIRDDEDSDIEIQSVNIDGHPLHLAVDGIMETELHFGIVDGRLLVAIGDGAIDQLISNLKTAEPGWMKSLREELPTQRMASMFRLDASELWSMADASGATIPEFLHLDELQDLIGVMDIQSDTMVTKMVLHCPEKTRGILSALDVQPLTLPQIAEIPADVTTAYAFQISIDRTWDLIKKAATEMAGQRQLDEFEQTVAEVTGLNFERDVLGSFHGSGYLYAKVDLMNPTGGLLASLRIKDPAVFKERFEDINAAIQDEIEFQNAGTYDLAESGGVTIHSVETDMLSVFWCQVEDQVLISTDRGSIRSHLRKRKRTAGKLAEVPEFKAMFADGHSDGSGNPIAFSVVDFASTMQLTLPILGAAFGESTPHPDFDFSFQDLPPAEVLANGLKTNMTAIYRTQKGFELVEHHTIPGTATVALSGVGAALLLPAVQQARHAARRIASLNNIRQLTIALLNYENTHGSFPTSQTRNGEGERLLSWRVHVLPYLEEQELYEKFHLDEPWDSPHNRQLISQMPAVFENMQLVLDEGMTCYLGVSGEDGILAAPDKASTDGKMNPGVTLAEVADGSSNTLIIVETNEENAVVWTKPEDFDPAGDADLRSRLEGTWLGGNILAGYCDGSTRVFGTDVTSEQLRKMMTKSDGQIVDTDEDR